jgi:ribonuclease D
MSDYPLISTVEEVEALAKRLRRERALAIDTEADSFFHYYDKVCLIQIAAKSGIYLVDPLALPEKGLEPLEPVLSDPSIRKVLHAAEYDLYVLQRYGGVRIRNLFDTMISAQLLGCSAVGLGALVKEHFGVELSKDQQRTDWSRRPLRDVQIEYAKSDVAYLIEMATLLEKKLREKKRLKWAQQEFLALEDRVWDEREFDGTGYLKIKGAKKLTPQGLAVLRELYLMRDRRAREIDRPPFKVLGNGTMLDLAQRPPRSKRALAGRKGVTDLVLRRMGEDLLASVERGLEGPEHPPLERKPSGRGRKRLDRRGEKLMEFLKKWRASQSGDLELDPGVFCANSALEQIAATAPESLDELRGLDTVKGWWVDAFGPQVLQALATERERLFERAKGPAAASPSRDGTAAKKSRSARRRARRRRARRSANAVGSSGETG